MINSFTSIVLALAFVLVGGINVWLVLEAWSRVKAAKASARMLALHRIGGYVFIALFCVMSFFMIARMRNGGGDASPTVTLHLALAMVLSPLLFIKVLIARYYKNQHSLLMPIGITIFVLAFVLVASTAGPYLTRVSKREEVSLDPGRVPPVTIDLNRAGDLMEKRCSKCHNLDRVVGVRKDAQDWLKTVDRMRARPDAGISEGDTRLIASYLVSQYRLDDSAAGTMQVQRALVDERCSRCHNLDRIFRTVQSAEDWRETVAQMADYAAGSTAALQPKDQRQIIDYLSSTQTPEAVKQRKAQADTALSTGVGLIAQTGAAGLQPIPTPRFGAKTVGFISLVALGMITLIVKRPARTVAPAVATAVAPPKPAAEPKDRAAAAARPSNNPFILELVQITQQTWDTKTLRFTVHGPQRLDALPANS